MKQAYSYKESLKSDYSDELINTYLLRPAAGVLVRVLYYTPITPNHITIAATLTGCVAAFIYLQDTPFTTALAGVVLTFKDLLDSADGQLARARQMYSRAGRFLDSIGDLLVNLLVFAAIGWIGQKHDPFGMALAFLAFAGTTLRVSYHVFYHTAYLHLQRRSAVNRLTEEITDEDRTEDEMTQWLHSLFLHLYGWQDRLMMRLDVWSRGTRRPAIGELWWSDRTGLRLSGLVGMGTELFLLTVCSLMDELPVYLVLNVLGMNLVWCLAVFYRRIVLARRLGRS